MKTKKKEEKKKEMLNILGMVKKIMNGSMIKSNDMLM